MIRISIIFVYKLEISLGNIQIASSQRLHCINCSLFLIPEAEAHRREIICSCQYDFSGLMMTFGTVHCVFASLMVDVRDLKPCFRILRPLPRLFHLRK